MAALLGMDVTENSISGGSRHQRSRRLSAVATHGTTFMLSQLARHSHIPPTPPKGHYNYHQSQQAETRHHHREHNYYHNWTQRPSTSYGTDDETDADELRMALMAPDKDDLYNILCIERGSSRRNIRHMYKRLALKLHPDRNPDQDTLDQFVRVCRAYAILSDKRKRNIYDAFGKASLQLFTILNEETSETEAFRDGVLIFVNYVIFPKWWFKLGLKTIACCLCLCCCCQAKRAVDDALGFVQYFERRNAAARNDPNAIAVLRPGVDLQEKAKQFKSLYFKPPVPIPLQWSVTGVNNGPRAAFSYRQHT